MKNTFLRESYLKIIRAMRFDLGLYRILAVFAIVAILAEPVMLPLDAHDPYWLRVAIAGGLLALFGSSYAWPTVRQHVGKLARIGLYLITIWAGWLLRNNDFSTPYHIHFLLVVLVAAANFRGVRQWAVYGVFVMLSSAFACWQASLEGLNIWPYLAATAFVLVAAELAMAFRITIGRELDRQRRLISSIFDNSPDAILLANLETLRIHSSNQNALRLFEVTGLNNAKNLHQHLSEWLQDYLKNKDNTARYSRSLCKLKTLTGKSIWGEVMITELSVDGDPELLISISDVTEKQSIARRLQFSSDILEHVDHLVLVADAQADIIYSTPSIQTLLGYRMEDVLGQGWWEIKRRNGEDTEASIAYIKALARGEVEAKQANYETRHVDGNGKEQWVLWKDSRTPNGLVMGVGMLHTRTRRDETVRSVIFNIADASSKVKNPGEFYHFIHQEIRRLIDTPNFYIAVYDSENDEVSFPYYMDAEDSNYFARASRKRKAGKGLTEYGIKARRAVLLSKDDIYELNEIGHVNVTGQAIPEVWLGVPLLHEDRVVGLITIQNYEKPNAYDQDDLLIVNFVASQVAQFVAKLQSDEALRMSEERFRSIYKQAAVGIAQLTPDGSFLQVNEKMTEIFGYDQEELFKMIPMDFTHPDDVDLGIDELIEVLEGKRTSYSKEKRYIHKQGHTVYALLNVSAYRENDVPVFVISVYEDITDKKRAQFETDTLLRLSTGLNTAESIDAAVAITMEELTQVDGWEYAEACWQDAMGEMQPCSRKILLHDGFEPLQGGNHCVAADIREAQFSGNVIWGNGAEAHPFARFVEQARQLQAVTTAILPILHEGEPIVILLLASRKEAPQHASLEKLATAVGSQLVAVHLRKMAESARIESENRYRAITQAAFEGIAIYQGNHIVDCNAAFARAFDYEPQEILQLQLTDLISDAEAAAVLARISDVNSGGVEFMGRKKSGETVSMEALSRQDQWHGQRANILAVRDITSQKLMEEARESARLDARFKAYIQNSAEIIKIVDVDGLIQYCSPSYSKIFGAEAESVLGRSNAELMLPEDREHYQEALQEVRKADQASHQLQLRFPAADGSVRFLQAKLTNLIDDPMVRGILISEGDITTVIEAQRSRQESEARFRALVEHATEAILVIDVGGDRLIEVNKNAEALFGRSREELLAISPGLLNTSFQPDGRSSEESQSLSYARALDGELVVYEWCFLNKQGEEIPCEIRLVKFPSATQQLLRASVTDITARKIAEFKMHQSREFLQQQNERLIELAASPAVNSGNLDLAFEEISKAVAELLQVSLAGIWLFDQKGEQAVCRREYDSEKQHYTSGRVVKVADHPRYFNLLERQRVIAVEDAKNSESLTEFLATSILPNDFASVLDAPFRHGGRIAGMIWTMHRHEKRSWEPEEQNLVASMADMVTLALQSWERKKAESELAETLTKMQATFESTRDGILLLDPKGYLMDYNEEFCKLSHVTKEELDSGKRFPGYDVMLQYIVEPELFKEAIFRIRKHPEAEERFVYQTTTGQVVEMYGRQMLVEGQLRGMLWFLHDITDLKRVEQALLENETKFRSLFSQANDAIILLDQSTFIECNTKAEEMWRLSREKLIGRKSYELSPEFQPDGQRSIDKAAFNTAGAYNGESQRFYWQHTRGDGEPFDAEVSLNRIQIGEHIYIQALVRDITERLKTETALRDSERNNKALLDGIPDLILRITDTGMILDFKQSDQETHLRLVPDAGGKYITDVLPRTLAQRVLEQTRQALLLGRGMQFESELKLNGEEVDYETRIVRSGASEVLAIIRDVTERKRTEKELIKRNFELDSFVYRASHDLKAPLNSLMGLISLVEGETQDAIVLNYIKMMNKSVVKLDTFIRDLADFSRNARLDLTQEQIDWQLLLDETLENLQFADGADRIQKNLHLDISGSFYSDPVRLGIIFNNLVSNAIKYQNLKRNDSQVNISVVREEDGAVITIADNGIGIAKEHQPKVYNLFFRASIQSYGSGMGMYIVKHAIDRIKGTIQLTSEEGQGTTFIVRLPDLGPPLAEDSLPQ